MMDFTQPGSPESALDKTLHERMQRAVELRQMLAQEAGRKADSYETMPLVRGAAGFEGRFGRKEKGCGPVPEQEHICLVADGALALQVQA